MPISTFLDGRTYKQLRGLTWLALSDTGYLRTGTVTSDLGGGGTLTWTQGTIGIPCRVDPLGGAEEVVAGRLSDRSTHVVTVPPNSVPTPADQFAITGRGTYEVTAVRDRTREWVQTFEVVQV